MSVAPLGNEVSLQVIVTVPAYPVVDATVTVEDPLPPAEIAAGEVAATVKVTGATGLTVTLTTVVSVMLPDLPVTVTA
jgi:hypothetical protein